MAGRFLVIWKLEVGRVGPETMAAVVRQLEYGRTLEAEGKVEARYHVVGAHGGAWIYRVESHEELDRLLARAPAYNYATYQVLPLAEMEEPPTILGREEGASA